MRTKLALCAAALLMLPAVASAQPKKIVIDPGHGGEDPGAVGNGMEEQAVNVDVGLKFKAMLEADTADAGGGGEWVALITRTDDSSVSLAARSAYANNQNADRFMSIHANSAGVTNATGTETFSYTEGGQGAALRNIVQEEMIAAWGLANRGNKVANFAVLRETAMPAELHELGFINNTAGDADPDKLASPEERQKAAEAHLRAIQRHYGIAEYIPNGEGGGETGEVAGVVVGSEGPVAGAQVSLDSGQEVVTPSDGTFVFTGVPVGTRGLTVIAEGYLDKVINVEVKVGERSETGEVTVTPSDGGDGEPGGDGDGGDGGDPAADGGGTVAGACAAGGGATGAPALLLLGLALAVRRRRRA
ncbi:MAG TPA: N-acetylmuramoyl-L-alanine amidase [Kofleriaceae bacterium]|nr:N-acetylmuramoyl-L-alanine amidase [Kofleriaceae bacterium]